MKCEPQAVVVVDWFGFVGCGGFDDFSGLEV